MTILLRRFINLMTKLLILQLFLLYFFTLFEFQACFNFLEHQLIVTVSIKQMLYDHTV